eukprot:CAMPEP_0116872224 /NCGR_PEP_ID=MMETSP0463-20121206/2928_1 /TAXON_ID=181622 /ORGANISM="Strombidinopsis sp, Strain SopsisLIS2011" /LENGTH=87 /DNA_ID=CAMNT_0004512139 /DNA_START=266 /DNA_END=529 /DNA_ORIENTATION=-
MAGSATNEFKIPILAQKKSFLSKRYAHLTGKENLKSSNVVIKPGNNSQNELFFGRTTTTTATTMTTPSASSQMTKNSSIDGSIQFDN